jgi:FKBP12-rapamycin complex-associated protein
MLFVEDEFFLVLVYQGLALRSPKVAYAYFKYNWATGNRRDALHMLRDFTRRFEDSLPISAGFGSKSDSRDSSLLASCSVEELSLLAHLKVKVGQWSLALLESLQQVESKPSFPFDSKFPLTLY